MADPERQHIRLAVGQTKVLEFTLDEIPAGGVASWTLRFRMRTSRGALLFEATTGDGIECTDEDNGVWEVTIPSDDTDEWKRGLPEWSLWRTDVPTESPLAVGGCEVYKTADRG